MNLENAAAYSSYQRRHQKIVESLSRKTGSDIVHIWTLENWKYNFTDISSRRGGLRFRFTSDVNPEVREACLKFGEWLRKEYIFPIRVPVYVKGKKYIKSMDGEMVHGTFFQPYDKRYEPYVRIATGNYTENLIRLGRDDALARILETIAHELTHYFQWINDIELTEIGYERQASSYAGYILDEYAETVEHP